MPLDPAAAAPPTSSAPRTLTARDALLALGLAPLSREEWAAAGAPCWRARREDGEEVSVTLLAGPAAESEARAALRAPLAEGLPRLLEVRRGPGLRALVHEAPRGPTLAREAARRGRLEPRVALEAGARVARALAAAHEAGFVHGAISGACIVLGRGEDESEDEGGLGQGHGHEGEGGGDGALAVLAGRLTDLGAPLVVAPAVAPGALAASPEQDLQSLGRALFAALAGEAASRGPAPAPGALLLARPDAPELGPAARVLERCMRLRPELGFYPDGRALAHALESAARRLGESRADLSGRFTREELCGVLQMLELQRKSGRVELSGAGAADASGALVLREGRIASARSGGSAGREALERLLSLPSGRFRVTFGAVPEGASEIPVSAALLEAARRRDEAPTR